MVNYFPRAYIDVSSPLGVASAPLGEITSLKIRIVSKSEGKLIRSGLTIFKVRAADDTGSIILTFYNSKYTVEALKTDAEYIVHGRIAGTPTNKEINAPMIFPSGGELKLIPVYPLTAGITSKAISNNIKQALAGLEGKIPDFLPQYIRSEFRLCQIEHALKNIHFPSGINMMKEAKRRLVFEELFIFSLALALLKGKRSVNAQKIEEYNISSFLEALKFVPTGAQIRAIDECAADMRSGAPMNRLLQGDVGSGKTLVAAALCRIAHMNGLQSVLMAPTEILARQHFKTLSDMLSGLGVAVELLTGSMRTAEKNTVKQKLKNGEASVCVGTHALLSEGVNFKSLALVITDEQHRFGVTQRMELSRKSENPHLLVMSATPIPRTLAMIIYGDLDISVLDEMPKGRAETETYCVDSGKRLRTFNFIKKHIDEGRQAYIVCPLIDRQENDAGLKPAAEYAETLSRGEFKGYSVGLLHGKMTAKEKDAVMRRFRQGEIQLLVSTTVIEVGVDVPNAAVMVIENAERFGLSQLHQLRGRVGRGGHKSFCILISDAESQDTRARLKALCESDDGFRLAQYDLETRGPGDFFGSRQHGIPLMKIADLSNDMSLLEQASECAKKLARNDPELSDPRHCRLKEKVENLQTFL